MVALGAYAWDATFRAIASVAGDPPRPRPEFGHGAEAGVGGYRIVGSYHPSQQNTFTGRLTASMFDAVIRRALEVATIPIVM